jgi:hypothetical protein
MDDVVCFVVPWHMGMRVYGMGCNMEASGALGASADGNGGIGQVEPLGKEPP